jgi:hypothetical protein
VPDLAETDVPEAEVIDGVPACPAPARTNMRYVHYVRCRAGAGTTLAHCARRW